VQTSRDILNICIVTTAYPPVIDGFSTYTRDLAVALTKLGHGVTVVWADSSGAVSGASSDSCSRGLRVVRFEPALDVFGRLLCRVTGSSRLSQSYQIYRILRRYQRERPFDVIEFSNWHAPAAVHSLFKLAPQILRITTTIHQVARSATVGNDDAKAHWKEQRAVKKLAQLEALTVRRSDVIIAPTTGHLNTIAEGSGLHLEDHRLRIIPFGVNVSDRRPAMCKRADREICRLLFVGRLSHRKGFDVLIAALPHIIAKAKTEVVMIIIGEDVRTPAGVSTWETLSGSLDEAVRRRIKYLGAVTDEERDDNYRNCDLFIAPSRYESFGLMYIEAMSYGVPAIGCRAGGIPDVIDHGITGLLVEPDNAPALAAAALQLVNDPEQRRRMGTQAKCNVARKFTCEQTAQATLDAYRSAMAGYQTGRF
jgi:glycogen(starch) synthase